MDYKAIFLDIDGTILMPDHSYSASTVEAIKQLKAQDITIFIATGRPLHEITGLAKELEIDNFIGYNGAYALYQNEEIVNEPMEEATVNRFTQMASEQHHELVLYTNGENYFTSLEDPSVQAFIEAFQMKKNMIYTENIADQVLGATIMKLKEDDVLHYQLEENIHLSQVNVEGMQHAYDIIRSNVNKGEAIKKILKRLKLDQEHAIAFGDGMNDKEMLASVGAGFAMGNAHIDLFQYATHRTTTVNDSGIYNGLKQIGLVK